MADIAMLVAEEYERRVKSSRKAGGTGDGSEGSTLLGVNWVLASSFVSELAEKAKIKMGEESYLEHTKWVLEPKSQLGLAASNCFFSA